MRVVWIRCIHKMHAQYADTVAMPTPSHADTVAIKKDCRMLMAVFVAMSHTQ